MKKILLAFLFLAGIGSVNAQEIKWMTLDEALALQKKDPKPIFMDVYTDWCGPCKQLDKATFHDPKIVDYISKNYYGVKFNAEGNSSVTYKGVKYGNPNFVAGQAGRNSMHDFAKSLNLEGYPTMVLFDKKGEISKNVVGYRNADQLLSEL